MNVCEICLKSFDRKAGLTQHKKKKIPCKPAILQGQPIETLQIQNTAVSLFSGCGGDTLGLETAGFKVIAFSELKKTFAATHLENFPESVYIMDSKKTSGDITKIEDTQFQIYRGKADIIFAGFPCQGFSHAGKKATTDPRNQLYQQFVRATKEIRPLFIIGENVQGLARMKSGPNSTDPLMLDCIKTAFEAIGYMLTYKIQEVTAFGVPQKRKRVVIVGWDTTRIKNFQPTKMWTEAEKLGAAKTTPIIRSFVTNTMEGAYRVPAEFIPEDFATYALEVTQDAEPTGTPHPYVVLKTDTDLLSCTKRVSPIHSEIIDIDAPSKTIICTYGHQPRLLIGLKKPDGTAYVRTMLPNELKQIQGFPANYKLKGTQSEQVIQIGNAVPPPMIECVAQALRQFM
uniref:DNA (cytosine-5-)-methyltransferase n=1 Tax=viral metagenome TaxID=1070528 RepID=A0A6C0KV77_9ZZZZ